MKSERGSGKKAGTKSASALREQIISDMDARLRAQAIRTIPIDRLPIAGAYMAAKLRQPNVILALSVDLDYMFSSERFIRIGGKWDFDKVNDEICAFAREVNAKQIIIGVSREMSFNDFLRFDAVYRILSSFGVRTVDVIEVIDGVYRSLMKPLVKDEGKLYCEQK